MVLTKELELPVIKSASAPRATRSAPLAGAVEEERELVNRMRSGDEAAFETFAGHYIPALYRFAVVRLHNERELTREIVQATVCKVFENLSSYRGDAPLFTWLCACCRNEIGGYFRRRQGKTFVDLDEAGAMTTGSNAEEQMMESEANNLVHVTLDHLPPRYSTALRLKYVEGLPVREIASRMDIGSKAAESLLTRAREAFRVLFDELAEQR